MRSPGRRQTGRYYVIFELIIAAKAASETHRGLDPDSSEVGHDRIADDAVKAIAPWRANERLVPDRAGWRASPGFGSVTAIPFP